MDNNKQIAYLKVKIKTGADNSGEATHLKNIKVWRYFKLSCILPMVRIAELLGDIEFSEDKNSDVDPRFHVRRPRAALRVSQRCFSSSFFPLSPTSLLHIALTARLASLAMPLPSHCQSKPLAFLCFLSQHHQLQVLLTFRTFRFIFRSTLFPTTTNFSSNSCTCLILGEKNDLWHRSEISPFCRRRFLCWISPIQHLTNIL